MLTVTSYEHTGLHRGTLPNVTNLSNSSQIGDELLDAQAGKPGALEMPDLFTCHVGNAMALGEENLLDWQDYFSEDEMADFVPGFAEAASVFVHWLTESQRNLDFVASAGYMPVRNDAIRQAQSTWPQRLANGESIDSLAEETWTLLCSFA